MPTISIGNESRYNLIRSNALNKLILFEIFEKLNRSFRCKLKSDADVGACIHSYHQDLRSSYIAPSGFIIAWLVALRIRSQGNWVSFPDQKRAWYVLAEAGRCRQLKGVRRSFDVMVVTGAALHQEPTTLFVICYEGRLVMPGSKFSRSACRRCPRAMEMFRPLAKYRAFERNPNLGLNEFSDLIRERVSWRDALTYVGLDRKKILMSTRNMCSRWLARNHLDNGPG